MRFTKIPAITAVTALLTTLITVGAPSEKAEALPASEYVPNDEISVKILSDGTHRGGKPLTYVTPSQRVP